MRVQGGRQIDSAESYNIAFQLVYYRHSSNGASCHSYIFDPDSEQQCVYLSNTVKA